MRQVTVTVTKSFIEYIKSEPVVFELYGHYQPQRITSPDDRINDVTLWVIVTVAVAAAAACIEYHHIPSSVTVAISFRRRVLRPLDYTS